jgi:hypothetical protein
VNYFAVMKLLRSYLYLLVCLFFLSVSWGQRPDSGQWVGLLDYGKLKIPFSFTVDHIGTDAFQLTLHNGTERILLTDLDRLADTIRVHLKPFDAFLKFKVSERMLSGTWEKPYRDLIVPFTAKQSQHRFLVKQASGMQVGERWAMTFKPGTSESYKGVGLFQQSGHSVTGTIMTEVGDFRFFEGLVDGDSLKFSSFDGAHGFYLLGKMDSGKWSGSFHFDPSYNEQWIATKDSLVELIDPFDFVQIQGDNLVPYYDILAAGSGKNAIDIHALKDKVVVIQLFGTWCPNSWDETRFLVDWYATKPKGVELIAVTFEPNYSQAYGLSRISQYRQHLNVPYDIYLGGRMSKSQAAIAFPFMDRIEAFPTLIIVDKQGNARYIHSYFNGPATGSYFENFKSEFRGKIEALLAE